MFPHIREIIIVFIFHCLTYFTYSYFLFLLYGCATWFVESQFLDQGLNPGHGSESPKSQSIGHQRTPLHLFLNNFSTYFFIMKRFKIQQHLLTLWPKHSPQIQCLRTSYFFCFCLLFCAYTLQEQREKKC